MNYKDNHQLQQRLLELHYDLLDEPQAAELRKAIQEDPDVAQQWAATLKLATKMSQAVAFPVDTPSVEQMRQWADEQESSTQVPSSDDQLASSRPVNAIPTNDHPASNVPLEKLSKAGRNGGAHQDHNDAAPSALSPRHQQSKPVVRADGGGVSPSTGAVGNRWWLQSFVFAVTAAAIGMLIIGSWYLERAPQRPAAGVRVQARLIPTHSSLTSNEFRVRTSRVDGTTTMGRMPVTPATLSFSVLAHNTVLYRGETETDSDGSGRIALPIRLTIPKDAKLRVEAKSNRGDAVSSILELPLPPTRCLTYLTTDRPVYRPGETVYFRSLTLQRHSLIANADVPVHYELQDPSGTVVPGATMEGVTDQGVGNGAFVIPTAAAGGTYTLVAKSLDDFFPEERVEFKVRSYRVPKFKKQLEFRHRSYGAGDSVAVDLRMQRASGEPVSGASVLATATVDDQVVHRQSARTSADGLCTIEFALPEIIDDGRGTVSVIVDDGGTRETITKTIPIHLGRVAVDFYPEGGYLVDGLDTRVYFMARNADGKPIHLQGEILNQNGDMVAQIETVRDGMGKFEFEPVHGQRYRLKVTRPLDVTNTPTLPSVVRGLPVMNTGDGVFDSHEPIRFRVTSTGPAKILVRAVCRGKLVGEKEVSLRVGDTPISVPVNNDVGGVIRLTVLDAETNPPQPLIERLVYRRYRKRINIDVIDDASLKKTPGEGVRLNIQVRDEQGDPMAAVLGVSVVDDTALSLSDHERPDLVTHYLLTSEIESPEDLEHANIYLHPDDRDAATALDLLLGVQGWRRFVSASAMAPELAFESQLMRLLEMDGSDDQQSRRQYDNVDRFMNTWFAYRRSLNRAWNQFLYHARILLMIVLGIWLLTFFAHLRRGASMRTASWLLIVSTSIWIYGCGQAAMTSVSEEAAARPDSGDEDRYAIDVDRQAAISNQKEDPAANATRPSEVDATESPSGTDESMDVREREESGLGNMGAPADPSGRASDSASGIGDREVQDPSESDTDDASFDRQVMASQISNQPRMLTKADLQRVLAARGLDAAALADQLLDSLRFPIRQYAHRYEPHDQGTRRDFTETLYWQPMLVTDSSGRATIRFDLSDALTGYRVHIDGHSMDGRIGSGDAAVTAQLPFSIDPKTPLEVTRGDLIDLPIAIDNQTDDLTEIELTADVSGALKLTEKPPRTITLDGHNRRRVYATLEALDGSPNQPSAVQIRASATHPTSGRQFGDAIRRPLVVAPQGYPHRASVAGTIDQRASVSIPVPEDLIPGTLSVTVRAFPSPIADVIAGVESILAEPHGCFEQASATNYPNTMALRYLEEQKEANPEFARRATEMIDRGYQKLIAFECQKKGFEWFGVDPGHEALSAFGLMEFVDMSRVMAVNQQLIDRTRQWLLARRDGQGGFKRNPRHLHVWSVQQEVVNAYVLWAITEADVAAGQRQRSAAELGRELEHLNQVASRSDDPYLIALSAAALMNAGLPQQGEVLLTRLVQLQQADGSLEGKTTVTSSGGLSRKMETTALAVIAWTNSNRNKAPARSAARWMTQNRLGNAGFGSTQATVLALKALLAVGAEQRPELGGELQVQAAGQTIGRVALPSARSGGEVVEITGLGSKLESFLTEQPQLQVELVASGTRGLNYAIDVSSHVARPASDDRCPLRLTTQLGPSGEDSPVVNDGEVVQVSATLANRTSQGQPMTVAIIGLPGGLEPRTEQLDELKEAGEFDYYELRPREVIMYWRSVEPDAEIQIGFDATATVPGRYTGPPSRTYLYYTAEQKWWVKPMTITIGR